MSDRVYVFVRKDISLADQMVQIGHVCLQAGGTFPIGQRTKLVLCEVEDSAHLFQVADLLDKINLRYEMFYEPSNAGGERLEWTALSTSPIKYKLESDCIKLWTNKETCSIISE